MILTQRNVVNALSDISKTTFLVSTANIVTLEGMENKRMLSAWNKGAKSVLLEDTSRQRVLTLKRIVRFARQVPGVTLKVRMQSQSATFVMLVVTTLKKV